MKTLGDKIKAIRTIRKLSQEDVAFELGITIAAYSRIENNHSDITLSRIEQIAKVLQMSIIELFMFGEKDPCESLKEELQNYKKHIDEKDREIMNLQRRIIEFLDKENRN